MEVEGYNKTTRNKKINIVKKIETNRKSYKIYRISTIKTMGSGS